MIFNRLTVSALHLTSDSLTVSTNLLVPIIAFVLWIIHMENTNRKSRFFTFNPSRIQVDVFLWDRYNPSSALFQTVGD